MSEALALKLEIDAKGASKTLGDLERASEALNDELKQTAVGSDEFKKLKSELIGVNSEIKNVELSMESLDNEQVASELGSVTGAIGDMTGAFVLLGGESETMQEMAANIQMAMGVSMGLKGAIEGVSSARKLLNHQMKTGTLLTKAMTAAQTAYNLVVGAGSKAMKVFKIALAATGIGAIVVAIGALVLNFDKVSAAVKSFADMVYQFFKPPIDLVIKGLQFLGIVASDEALAQEAAAHKTIKASEERREEIEKLQKRNEELNESVNNGLEFEIKKRKAIGKDTTELERKLLEQRIEQARIEQKLQLQKTELLVKEFALKVQMGDFDKEQTDAFLENAKAQIQALKDNSKNIRDLKQSLDLFEITTEKKKNDKLKQIRKKEAKEKEKEIEEELVIVKSRAAVEIEIDNEVTENKKSNLLLMGELLAEENAKELERIKAEKEAQLDLQNAKFDLASNSLTALADLNDAFAGKSEAQQRKAFERNKKIQSAQAMISAAQGLVNILGQSSIIPEPFATIQKGVNIGILAATLAASLKRINSAKFGGSGSSVQAPSLGGGGGGTSAPTLNPISNTNTVIGQDNKVFVTETDISNTQNKVKVIEDQATF